MNIEKIIKDVSKEIQNGKNIDLECTIGQIPYKIKFQKPDPDNGINIPSIIALPRVKNMGKQIVLESNNLETGNFEHILEQGLHTSMKLAILTDNEPATIVVPLLPSYRDPPYFQQLSRDCFKLSPGDINYRIDEQVVRIIEKTKKTIKEERGIDLEDKIFLNGYSSSGVFAQRFALLHPELVDTVCIGGASGSIPIPTEDLGYPLGVEDYKELTGNDFDIDSYRRIDFTYYVGEMETKNKCDTRLDEKGNPAPMHDLSYFDRSIPKEIGQKQRELFGINLFDRANNTIELLTSNGIKVKHIIIPGRTHSNNNSGIGVNEIGDKIVNDTYRKSREINSMLNSQDNIKNNNRKNYL